jgi:enoyl-CoA hydratase/carnithine racemase
MDFEHLVLKSEGPAWEIVLNRPDRRNALSLELMRELIDALRTADGRVIVISGTGPCFSAGHDLSEMIGRSAAFYSELFEVCTELMQTIQEVPQPVIAKVHGVATAAGCQLVASCDLVVAEQGARFGTPGVKIGLFCSTPMVPLTRSIGRKRAMHMLLTGDLIDCDTAADWGLVNLVVPADTLDDAVSDLVGKISAASPLTVRIGKQAFYQQVDSEQGNAYDVTKSVMALNAMTDDAQEGMQAFLDKREPVWKGS